MKPNECLLHFSNFSPDFPHRRRDFLTEPIFGRLHFPIPGHQEPDRSQCDRRDHGNPHGPNPFRPHVTGLADQSGAKGAKNTPPRVSDDNHINQSERKSPQLWVCKHPRITLPIVGASTVCPGPATIKKTAMSRTRNKATEPPRTFRMHHAPSKA